MIFKKKWIPLPYFKDNSINKDVMYPTDWVRLYFDADDDYNKIQLVKLIQQLAALLYQLIPQVLITALSVIKLYKIVQ